MDYGKSMCSFDTVYSQYFIVIAVIIRSIIIIIIITIMGIIYATRARAFSGTTVLFYAPAAFADTNISALDSNSRSCVRLVKHSCEYNNAV